MTVLTNGRRFACLVIAFVLFVVVIEWNEKNEQRQNTAVVINENRRKLFHIKKRSRCEGNDECFFAVEAEEGGDNKDNAISNRFGTSLANIFLTNGGAGSGGSFSTGSGVSLPSQQPANGATQISGTGLFGFTFQTSSNTNPTTPTNTGGGETALGSTTPSTNTPPSIGLGNLFTFPLGNTNNNGNGGGSGSSIFGNIVNNGQQNPPITTGGLPATGGGGSTTGTGNNGNGQITIATLGNILSPFIGPQTNTNPPSSTSSLINGGLVTSTAPSTSATTTARYLVTFENLWSSVRHPPLYPTALPPSSNAPHWSRPVAAHHNRNYRMWQTGGTATAGVQSVAETGNTGALLNELLRTNGAVGGYGLGPLGQMFNRNQQSQQFFLETNTTHPLISTVVMIAPSPDWFTGFTDFDPRSSGFGASSTWYSSFTVETYPYDAGTDSGLTYLAPNAPTNPQGTISRITPQSTPSGVFVRDGNILPVARWTFQLQ